MSYRPNTGKQTEPLLARHIAAGPAAHWLWQAVRAHKTGVKFRRQVPFGPYVVDFCSHQARLVIALCGPARDSWLRSGDLALRAYVQALGYRLITLTDNEVLDQTDLVLERIAAVVGAVTHPPISAARFPWVPTTASIDGGVTEDAAGCGAPKARAKPCLVTGTDAPGRPRFACLQRNRI